MTRPNKQSLTDDLVEITSRLPWWVGVALAALSYVLLHAVAQRPLPASMHAGQVGNLAVSALWRGLVMGGQYVLPFIFLLAAGVSAFKRRKDAQGHDAADQRADGAGYMKWRDFEILVCEYFRRQGFKVLDNGDGGTDGSVDMLLQKGPDRYLVQCKHWRALRVGVQPVRELHGVIATGRVAGGFVVTSGEFTDEARHFSEGRELQLIDGKALLRGIRAQAEAVSAPVVRPALMPEAPPRIAEPVVRALPVCPLCSAEMVLRQVSSGTLSGKRFWGCSRYADTRCQGTRKLT
ncbi:MAG TPA: restriction endonuclease [Polaromonas sp.]|nr:restriction endonuclease [Polaromonas sp.]